MVLDYTILVVGIVVFVMVERELLHARCLAHKSGSALLRERGSSCGATQTHMRARARARAQVHPST